MKELFTVVYGVNNKRLFSDIYGNKFLLSPHGNTTYEIFIGNDDSVSNLTNMIGYIDTKGLSDKEIFVQIISKAAVFKYLAEAKNRETPKFKEIQVRAHTRKIAV